MEALVAEEALEAEGSLEACETVVTEVLLEVGALALGESGGGGWDGGGMCVKAGDGWWLRTIGGR